MLRDSEKLLLSITEPLHYSTLGYCLTEVTVMKQWALRAISTTGMTMLRSELLPFVMRKLLILCAVMIYSRSV